ncbi:MAG: hypothetical protein DMF60_08010 [Acidobacteria bacterium]|nr:MAG: hypothetical protein DMF60_08010 [Acidobacteriota bacterium]
MVRVTVANRHSFIGGKCDDFKEQTDPLVAQPVGDNKHAEPRLAMTAALSASGPHPSLGDEARVFDRLVGTWDCDYTFYAEDGSATHASGELRFGWIIDGRALQDIWIRYPRKGADERSIGTSVRFFDNKLKMWRVVFVGPEHGVLITVQGGVEGNRIVLRGVDDHGSSLRWSFNDIQPNSFIWRGEASRDVGKTWRLEEEHHMRRRGGAQAFIGASATIAAGKSRSAIAFEQLTSLVGEWKGVKDGAKMKLVYTLTADGSALMEEFRPEKGPVMITMFTVNEDRLIATHYCSAGNQPQMTTEAITEPNTKRLAFSLVRVTGLTTPEDWHNTGLVVLREDKDHLTQEWTYQFKGETGKTVFHFVRER